MITVALHITIRRYEKHDGLIEKIESIRLELMKAANEKKSFTDDTVVRFSQELDFYPLL
ncbi:aspartyl-phosphate phosphatase Spo0E family protein [Paenibacillus profundus]|uniref:Aspartyl-phosphate phosphatase Spo0E family protein n=1 Tax=Paenibacillus profundus TaxID=1173085 RepID=A0ABS8YM73_9BACL|nr:Spo0E family sporulation regulatory protein-aspartic acid phosphatase [Paenibacillus profundus]MCE5172652.1 aspartyl-phosphate phosphatase Spo0E family protein [Paenibacillus profundus]